MDVKVRYVAWEEKTMLSQTVEYSLRAMVYLAGQDGRSCTTEQISRVTLVPAPYLSKVLQNMNRAGLVRSQRGIHGGFSLLKPPDEITILEVVNAVEPVQRIRTCPLGLASHGIHLCPLHRRLDDALATVEEAFRASTLAEVLADPSPSIPLCEFPPQQSETPG